MIASNSLRSTLAPRLPRARNLSKIRIRFLRLAGLQTIGGKAVRLFVLDQTAGGCRCYLRPDKERFLRVVSITT